MTDFSREPDAVLAENLAQGYVGLHFQQGVPILDRDLNLMQDLLATTVRRILSEFLGSGVAPVTLADGTTPNDAFQIKAVTDPGQDNDFVVSAGSGPPGRCLVNGLEVTIAADRAYSAQPPDPLHPLDALHSPASGSRIDTVYLDVFVTTDESGAVMDNPDDIVVQTSVRLRPTWLARVAVGSPTVPDPVPAGHSFLPLAQLHRQAGKEHITPTTIFDTRALLYSVSDLRRFLVDPVITADTTGAGRVGDPVKVTGLNFLISPSETIQVFFGTTPAVGVTTAPVNPAQPNLTTLTMSVPTFNPSLSGNPELPLTVVTGHGFAVRTFRVLDSPHP